MNQLIRFDFVIAKVISEIFWKYLGMSSNSVKRANNTGLRGHRVDEFVFVIKIKKEVCTSIHTSSLPSHCTFLNVHFSKNLTFFIQNRFFDHLRAFKKLITMVYITLH